jgi:hypothetical protein
MLVLRQAGHDDCVHSNHVGLATSSASVNGKPVLAPSTIRLSPAEIAQRRKDYKCFHCDEFFTNGHKLLYKHFFIIEMLSEGEEEDGAPGEGEPMILIHALTGIQPRHGRTMQLHVIVNRASLLTLLRHGRTMQLHIIVNRASLLTLLNSGSTHNFIDTKATAWVDLVLVDRSDPRHRANEDHLKTSHHK